MAQTSKLLSLIQPGHPHVAHTGLKEQYLTCKCFSCQCSYILFNLRCLSLLLTWARAWPHPTPIGTPAWGLTFLAWPQTCLHAVDLPGGLGSWPTQDSLCLGTVGLHLWPVTHCPCLAAHHGAAPLLLLPDRRGALAASTLLLTTSPCTAPAQDFQHHRIWWSGLPRKRSLEGRHCTLGKVQWVWHVPKATHCEFATIAEPWLTSSLIHGGKIPGTISPNPAIFSLHSWFSFCFLFSTVFKLHNFQVVKIFKNI